MSLQEEIERKYMRILHWHDTQQEIRLIEIQVLPEIINKVLDAVDRKIDAEGGKFDPSDDLEKGYDDGLAAALKAVSQLRPKS